MKILIYSGIYKNKGTGNLLRSVCLFEYIKKTKKNDIVYLTSNNIKIANEIISSFNFDVKVTKKWDKFKFDLVLYDSPSLSLDKIKKLKDHASKLVALDFFNYNCNLIDVIINLYNHNKKNINNFKGQIYQGLEYSIIKPEVDKYRNHNINLKKEKPSILITFGGEDPDSKTLKTLRTIKNKNINAKVLVGYLNKDKKEILKNYSNQFDVINPVSEIGKLMSESDIVICSGGTTLLESISLGNPVLALSQNENEKKFINYIKNKIKLFELEEIDFLIKNFNDKNFRKKIKKDYQNILDNRGKERIYKIIKTTLERSYT